MKTMTAAEIRQSYLDFFASKQHKIVPSAPVYLPSDKTLMFVNAGMVPFKDIFLGAAKPEATRVADTQKCIRVSGKQNDLEEVGRDTYHHTFFEMLGNWSFGDYYKKEAITWAWELLTKVWELPKDRLWVTVYQDDDEAMGMWKELTDIDPARVLRFDEKDNFWEMGDTGPCGPCSEIHFDRSPNADATAEMVNADYESLIEIWNLVFIQYNRRQDGSLEELPSKHIDTGMGFERLVAVIQGKDSNYDTDVFTPYIEALQKLTGKPYEGEYGVAMRVIADHLRMLSAAIADGVTPSNEGRGYVLRRLLRRAALYGRKLGMEKPFITELFPQIEATLGVAFPEIVANKDKIIQRIHAEEESFVSNLERGSKLFTKLTDELQTDGKSEIDGDQAFELYGTYGFPIDMTRLMASDVDFTVDEPGFEARLAEEKAKDRERGKGPAGDFADLTADLVAAEISTAFTGYTATEDETEVLAVREGRYVLLKETPFYSESGGQQGDTGSITSDSATFIVEDTQRPATGIVLHIGEFESGTFAAGDTVRAVVNADRRLNLERHHSATHIMNYALRDVVSDDIRQAGSLVTPERLRFDFTWPEALSAEQLARIERDVNRCIMRNDMIVTEEIPFTEVQQRGDIIAVFDEKYGDLVRVVDIGGYSKELCGGTHVERAGAIGGFRIVAETSVSAGVRRLEAVCGTGATELTVQQTSILKQLAQRLSIPAEEIPSRLDALLDQNKKLERELKQQSAKSALGQVDELVGQLQDVNGVPVLAAVVSGQGMDGLRTLMDTLRQKVPSGVIVLGGDGSDKASFVATVTEDLVAKGVHAGKIIGQVAKIADGGGGGKPDKAQAGGKDASKVAEAIAKVPEFL